MLKDETRSKKVVALKFDPAKDSAPKMAAKGRGYIADKILEIAKEFDIPIKEDRDLIELLYKIEIEEEIPSELYMVIAEILAFIYKVNKNIKSDSITLRGNNKNG